MWVPSLTQKSNTTKNAYLFNATHVNHETKTTFFKRCISRYSIIIEKMQQYVNANLLFYKKFKIIVILHWTLLHMSTTMKNFHSVNVIYIITSRNKILSHISGTVNKTRPLLNNGWVTLPRTAYGWSCLLLTYHNM